MDIRRNLCSILVIALLVVIYFCLCSSSPVSYKEVQTTPRKYIDRFKIKKEHDTIPTNETAQPKNSSGYVVGHRHIIQGGHPKFSFKVKSVLPGEKTMKQSDEDDDDDDDGGEYGGLEYAEDESRDGKKDHCKDSVPMMVIRELDMVAVEIPMPEAQKEQKEWSEWSPCNKPCGDGVQSRWRFKPGVQEKDQQFRTCHLADCSSKLN